MVRNNVGMAVAITENWLPVFQGRGRRCAVPSESEVGEDIR